MRLAAEQGMPHWQAQAGITGGWAAALRGDTGSTELLRRYTQGLMGMGARATMSVYYAAIVETELREGKFEAARTTLQEAMAFVEQTNERLYEAGLWILWGRVAYAELGVEGARVAVEHFRRAVTVARRQGANGLLAGALRALEPYGLGAI